MTTRSTARRPTARLNAPIGARCFLTIEELRSQVAALEGLNAPFGARCFLTSLPQASTLLALSSLNAPFGARCFLTRGGEGDGVFPVAVLMHLLALGAF